MKEWREKELLAKGYDIWNGEIKSADLTMKDHGCISLSLVIEGNGCGLVYGGYSLGQGYLGATKFTSSKDAMVYIMRIMDTIGVERFSDLKGKYVRVASKGWSSTVKIIGNIIKDKWFDEETFFIDVMEE